MDKCKTCTVKSDLVNVCLQATAGYTERRLVRKKYFSFKLTGKVILGVIVFVTVFFRDGLYG